MATSSEVSAGDVVQATDYNKLRTDVRATHDHEGTEGQQLNAANAFDAGTLGVARGGTGAATHTDGGLLIGKGTAAFENTGVLAKGTLVVGDGTTNPTTRAVGSNDQVLTADSTETDGVKWASSGAIPNDADSYAKIRKYGG